MTEVEEPGTSKTDAIKTDSDPGDIEFKQISISSSDDLNWLFQNKDLLEKHGIKFDTSHLKSGFTNQIIPSAVVKSSKQKSPSSARSRTVSNHDDVYVEFLEQPQQRGLRFRYECESRFGGSIHGERSASSKKTFPTIKIHNYVGTAVIVVSCVTNEKPFRPHPHNLVGKNCRKGVCTIKVTDSNVISFQHLSIQCAKRKDIKDNLRQRQDINVDPFLSGFKHIDTADNIDRNVVRLCFQVFIPDESGRITRIIPPIVSHPIYDKKSLNELVICRVSRSSGSPKGGDEVFLLCEKINREDIDVRFYKTTRDGTLEWEASGIFSSYDIHRQYAIVFKTPPYKDKNIIRPVEVKFQLVCKSSSDCSDPTNFVYIPDEPDPDHIILQKKRKVDQLKRFDMFSDNTDFLPFRGTKHGTPTKPKKGVNNAKKTGPEESSQQVTEKPSSAVYSDIIEKIVSDNDVIIRENLESYKKSANRSRRVLPSGNDEEPVTNSLVQSELTSEEAQLSTNTKELPKQNSPRGRKRRAKQIKEQNLHTSTEKEKSQLPSTVEEDPTLIFPGNGVVCVKIENMEVNSDNENMEVNLATENTSETQSIAGIEDGICKCEIISDAEGISKVQSESKSKQQTERNDGEYLQITDGNSTDVLENNDDDNDDDDASIQIMYQKLTCKKIVPNVSNSGSIMENIEGKMNENNRENLDGTESGSGIEERTFTHSGMTVEELTSLLRQNFSIVLDEINPSKVIDIMIKDHPVIDELRSIINPLNARKQRALQFVLELLANRKEMIHSFWNAMAIEYIFCYKTIMSKDIPPRLHLSEHTMCDKCSSRAFQEFMKSCDSLPEDLLIQLFQNEVLEVEKMLQLINCFDKEKQLQAFRVITEEDNIPWVKFVESICPLEDMKAARIKFAIANMNFSPCLDCEKTFNVIKSLCKSENGDSSQGSKIFNLDFKDFSSKGSTSRIALFTLNTSKNEEKIVEAILSKKDEINAAIAPYGVIKGAWCGSVVIVLKLTSQNGRSNEIENTIISVVTKIFEDEDIKNHLHESEIDMQVSVSDDEGSSLEDQVSKKISILANAALLLEELDIRDFMEPFADHGIMDKMEFRTKFNLSKLFRKQRTQLFLEYVLHSQLEVLQVFFEVLFNGDCCECLKFRMKNSIENAQTNLFETKKEKSSADVLNSQDASISDAKDSDFFSDLEMSCENDEEELLCMETEAVSKNGICESERTVEKEKVVDGGTSLNLHSGKKSKTRNKITVALHKTKSPKVRKRARKNVNKKTANHLNLMKPCGNGNSVESSPSKFRSDICKEGEIQIREEINSVFQKQDEPVVCMPCTDQNKADADQGISQQGQGDTQTGQVDSQGQGRTQQGLDDTQQGLDDTQQVQSDTEQVKGDAQQVQVSESDVQQIQGDTQQGHGDGEDLKETETSQYPEHPCDVINEKLLDDKYKDAHKEENAESMDVQEGKQEVSLENKTVTFTEAHSSNQVVRTDKEATSVEAMIRQNAQLGPNSCTVSIQKLEIQHITKTHVYNFTQKTKNNVQSKYAQIGSHNDITTGDTTHKQSTSV